MNGIPPSIYDRLESVLLKCGPFSSDSELKTIFIDKRLYSWLDGIPEADNPTNRVRSVILLLSQRYNHLNENGLVLFLHVISERIHFDDICNSQLTELAVNLERVLSVAELSEVKSGYGKTIKEEELADEIVRVLNEEAESEFIHQIVAFIGFERAQSFYQRTLEIEVSGGMLTRYGDRRRTPGGVFFTLVKDNTTALEREMLFPKGIQQLPRNYVIKEIRNFTKIQLRIGVARINRVLEESVFLEESKRFRIIQLQELLLEQMPKLEI